jgi:hypothetical protein
MNGSPPDELGLKYRSDSGYFRPNASYSQGASTRAGCDIRSRSSVYEELVAGGVRPGGLYLHVRSLRRCGNEERVLTKLGLGSRHNVTGSDLKSRGA